VFSAFFGLIISCFTAWLVALATYWLGAKVCTTVMSHTRLLPLYQGFRVRPSGLLSPVKSMGSKIEGRSVQVNDPLRRVDG